MKGFIRGDSRRIVLKAFNHIYNSVVNFCGIIFIFVERQKNIRKIYAFKWTRHFKLPLNLELRLREDG